ncbi:Hypothetical predicted protein, partial [Marmota monax]
IGLDLSRNAGWREAEMSCTEEAAGLTVYSTKSKSMEEEDHIHHLIKSSRGALSGT